MYSKKPGLGYILNLINWNSFKIEKILVLQVSKFRRADVSQSEPKSEGK